MIELLFQASATRYGIVVTTSDAHALRARLYIERRKANNPRLETLVLSPSRVNPETELWIINTAPSEEQDSAKEIPPPS